MMNMTMPEAGAHLDLWATRVAAEYRESPGLSLTLRQAARFWGLSPEFCGEVLSRLKASGHLRETPAGRFVHAGLAAARRRA